MARKGAHLKIEDESESGRAPDPSPESTLAPELMDFNVWFSLKVAEDPRIQEWQRKQLAAFMKSHGLSEKEEKARFDIAFERF